jgi:hypothetical protein
MIDNLKENFENYSNQIKQTINENKLSFFCKSCQTLIFTKHEIDSVYIIDENNIGFVIDPNTVQKIFNVKKKNNEIKRKINEIDKKDIAYIEICCLNCEFIIGWLIGVCSKNDYFLLNNALILEYNLTTYITDKNDFYEFSFSEYLKDNFSKDLDDMIEKVGDRIDDMNVLYDKLTKTYVYFKMKDKMIETVDYLNDITKVAEYANYLVNSNINNN